MGFGFGFVLMVSTTVVEGRRCASLTGINSPVLASRPIFLVPIDTSGSEKERNQPLTPRRLVRLARKRRYEGEEAGYRLIAARSQIPEMGCHVNYNLCQRNS